MTIHITYIDGSEDCLAGHTYLPVTTFNSKEITW